MKKLSASMTIIAVTLSGCAMSEGDFPSLQKRPYEDGAAIAESEALPAVDIALPADVQSDLNAAVARSGAAHSQFQSRLPAVKRRVDAARNAAVSSESWVAAHVELAALEGDRSPSVEALADIDALFRGQLERETVAGESGGTTIIARQRDVVQAQVDRQQTEIDAMMNRLR